MTGEITGDCDYHDCSQWAVAKFSINADVGNPSVGYYCETHAKQFAENSDSHHRIQPKPDS